LDSNPYTPPDDRGLTPGGGRPAYVLGDGADLPFAGAFDAVFSAATFHWIPDHERLFRSLYTALKPGGRVVAQCGGARNLDRLYGRARALMQSADYARHFSGWRDFNHFENVADTEDRLARAGFADIDVSLTESPVRFESPEQFSEFVSAVCLRHHLDRLPAGDRDGFMRRITDQAIDDDPPLTLDYWRLNISARKADA
jgi:trans-aconitate 2-methyltransferase